MKSELIRVRLDLAGAVPLWPSSWLEGTGATPRPRPGSPARALILPVAVGGDGDAAAATSFQAKSSRKSAAPTDEITPDANSPAHIARWMAVAIDAGAILVEPLTSTDAGWVDCWFFFDEEVPCG